MFFMKKSKLVLGVLSMVMLYVLGCANANDKSSSQIANWSRGSALIGQAGATGYGYGYPANVQGDSYDQYGWAQRIRNLYSADGSPALPGTINTYNSVRLIMSDINTNGTQLIVTNQTMITIQVQTDAGGPYNLTLPLKGGTFNSMTGQLNATYGDQFGDVQINATVYGSRMQGQIYSQAQSLGTFTM